MKYKPMIWLFMTARMKKGLLKRMDEEQLKDLLVKAKPIYKDLAVFKW